MPLTIDEIPSADGCNTEVQLSDALVWVCGHWYKPEQAERVAFAIHRALAYRAVLPALNILRAERDKAKDDLAKSTTKG